MDKDDKLVLLEHLRQLNDTLTRLSSRRRRLRAERRVRLGQLKNTMTFILSFVLTALMLDLRTDFSLPCKLIVEEHFLYDSIFTRI